MTTRDLTPTPEDMALDLHALLALLDGIDHPFRGDPERYRALVVKWMNEGFPEWKATIRRALAAEALHKEELAVSAELSDLCEQWHKVAVAAEVEVARLRSILARAESEG